MNKTCHFCNKPAKTFCINNTALALCTSCQLDLYKALAKGIIPKSPTNIFIKQKEFKLNEK